MRIAKPKVSKPYPIAIKYGLDQIRAEGFYMLLSHNFTEEHFVVPEGRTSGEIMLVHFNRSIDTIEVLREIDRMGFEPCCVAELAAFGMAYPELTEGVKVVALVQGKFLSDGWSGYAKSIPLARAPIFRSLIKWYLNDSWEPDDRFLVRHKPKGE